MFCASHTEVWNRHEHTFRLRFGYDGLEKRLDLGISDGAFGPRMPSLSTLMKVWRPTVRPLPLLIKSFDVQDTLRQIQSALAGEAEVTSLRRASGGDLPSNNEMQRTKHGWAGASPLIDQCWADLEGAMEFPTLVGKSIAS